MIQISADWLQAAATRKVFDLLGGNGHQAYAVGGCVRDTLMDQPVGDVDFATNARPERVLVLAQDAGIKAIPTGIDHGTITLVIDHTPFEITTFRKDVETDGRRAVVAFADDLTTDSLRRDFTVNALYVGAGGTITDPQGGLQDCDERHIRFIGDADERIREDALRILRFFRFYASHGSATNGPDPDGLAACAANGDLLDELSAERITTEITKLLSVANPAPALATMDQSGILGRILPGATSAPMAPLVDLEAGRPPRWTRRLIALGGELRRLRLSKNSMREIEALRSALEHGDPDISKRAYRYGADAAIDSTLILGATPDDARAKAGAAQVFPISAHDLMPGIQAGPELGAALKRLEKQWVASEFRATKTELLKKFSPR